MDSIRGSLLHTVNFVNCDLRAYAFSRMRKVQRKKIIEKENEKQRIRGDMRMYLRGIGEKQRRESKKKKEWSVQP